jgi:FAD/FMN-containing dehydrogenase
MADWIDALEAQLSPGSVLRPERDDLAAYEREWRGRYHSKALAVLRPDTPESLSIMVKACTAEGVAMVPQGGNTGLVGGAVARGDRTEVIVQLGRMKAIRHLDPASALMVAEAGVAVSVAKTPHVPTDFAWRWTWHPANRPPWVGYWRPMLAVC